MLLFTPNTGNLRRHHDLLGDHVVDTVFESSSKSLFPKSSKKPSASLQPRLLVSKICSAEQLSSSSSSAGRIIKGPQTQSILSLYRYDRHDHIDIDSNLSVCGPFIMVEVMIFCIRKGVNG
jgi:hypothetical protein